MMSPAALSLLTSTFQEGAARNRALGVWGSIAAGGAAAGMIIGGVLTDLANWRWVFLVNVPVGLAVILAARRVVPESRATAGATLDVPGAATLTAALAALVRQSRPEPSQKHNPSCSGDLRVPESSARRRPHGRRTGDPPGHADRLPEGAVAVAHTPRPDDP
jgi:MFS family permease